MLTTMLAVVAMAMPLWGNAQTYGSDDQDGPDVDPPGRVARVNLIDGSAALRPDGADAWVDDVLNRPLGSGDQLWVESNSRLEMHIGSTALRMGGRSGLGVELVDDQQVQLRLNAGSIDVRVRDMDRDEHFEVETPDYTVALLTPGDYRLDVNDEGNLTLVTVRAGSADVSRGGRFYRVDAGQRGAFDSGGNGSAEIAGLPARDALDRWADERDGREDNSQSARYVSRDVVGYEALDGYGSWSSEPDYGNVWYPTVAVGWTPFYYGHWVYVAPWGWTWIDDAPWGFAPSHYGRWVHVTRGGNPRWGWVPGPRRVERPMYAPAIVAWVSNAGPGRVGWVPLGYRDVYVPPYRVSSGYAQRVNMRNAPISVTVINNYYNSRGPRPGPGNSPDRRYAHAGIAGAVVTMNQDNFAAARAVQRNAQKFAGRDVQFNGPASGPPAGPVGPGNGPRPANRLVPPPNQSSFGRAIAQPPRDVPPTVQRSIAERRERDARRGPPNVQQGGQVQQDVSGRGRDNAPPGPQRSWQQGPQQIQQQRQSQERASQQGQSVQPQAAPPQRGEEGVRMPPRTPERVQLDQQREQNQRDQAQRDQVQRERAQRDEIIQRQRVQDQEAQRQRQVQQDNDQRRQQAPQQQYQREQLQREQQRAEQLQREQSQRVEVQRQQQVQQQAIQRQQQAQQQQMQRQGEQRAQQQRQREDDERAREKRKKDDDKGRQ